MAETAKLKVTLMRSPAGRTRAHRACVTGLGLRKRLQFVIVPDTPEIRGMIATVSYLLRVEPA